MTFPITESGLAISAHRPPVYVTNADFEVLSGLLTHDGAAPGAALLSEELARAAAPSRLEPDTPFVRLRSRVWFEDLDSGVRREVELALPRDASIDDNRISVLSPIGAALFGLTKGEIFGWVGPDRRSRRIRILEVLEPPA